MDYVIYICVVYQPYKVLSAYVNLFTFLYLMNFIKGELFTQAFQYTKYYLLTDMKALFL